MDHQTACWVLSDARLTEGVTHMNTFTMDAYEIARFIKESKKKTPVKLYIKGETLLSLSYGNLKFFGDNQSMIIFGEIQEIDVLLKENQQYIKTMLSNLIEEILRFHS
jgi:hypothetical protein